MQTTQIILFGHGRSDPLALALAEDVGFLATLENACEQLGIPGHCRSEIVIAVVDEDERLHEGRWREFLSSDRPKHIYAGHCHHLEVTVSFNGASKSHSFAASAKVKRVLHWAIHAFGVTPHDAPKMELRIDENGKGLPPEKPIGAFIPGRECQLKLYLVNKEIHNG